ncbi:MAG: hypothetical protein IT379_18805 [Deltaproteobacteria bacterium]|nr:hypothetical protein [Deltaproteobacteria bacterium]
MSTKIVWILLASSIAACGDDDGGSTTPDTGPADTGTTDMGAPDMGAPDMATPDTGPGDTGTPDAGGGDVARGEYLVLNVALCGDCHTPRDAMGAPMEDMFLAGGFFGDLDPTDPDVGAVYTRNLTPHATGLADWTDAEIKNAFLNGMSKHGHALLPIMPYYVLHNMTDEDADAIVAYLRTIPAVDNAIPANQVDAPPGPSPSVPEAMIPHTTLDEADPDYEAAERGRYLAGRIGVCMECHTEHNMPGPGPVLREDRLFAGGEGFPAALLGVPSPPFPEVIFTRNLTPDATGIQGWTAIQVARALAEGIDEEGQGLCPPMPRFGMTEEDRLAIGTYLTTLAPVASPMPIPECVPPAM